MKVEYVEKDKLDDVLLLYNSKINDIIDAKRSQDAQIVTLRQSVQFLSGQVDRLNAKLFPKCPTCHQSMPEPGHAGMTQQETKEPESVITGLIR